MTDSIIIRHARYTEDWTALERGELLAVIDQGTDPGIDERTLNEVLDREKLHEFEFAKICCSPMQRALQTAEQIADVLGLTIEPKDSLREYRFDGIPREVFESGSESVRQYLLDEAAEKAVSRSLVRTLEEPECLFISHGFKMRRIYENRFDGDFSHLRDDDRFRSYLTGFDLADGRPLSFNRSVRFDA